VNQALPDEVYAEVTRLSAAGNDLVDDGDYFGAVNEFARALAILPAPASRWDAFVWLHVAIGDTLFFAGKYEEALATLQRASPIDDSATNPFIWLRRGQAHFELGETKLADDCLTRAYESGGIEIFRREDPKYAEYILAKIDPDALEAATHDAYYDIVGWYQVSESWRFFEALKQAGVRFRFQDSQSALESIDPRHSGYYHRAGQLLVWAHREDEERFHEIHRQIFSSRPKADWREGLGD
jgi:tetratricopeptide (TPR) repeat protein